MNKNLKRLLIGSLLIPTTVFGANKITYTCSVTISSNESISDTTYTNSNDNENVLIVDGGSSSLDNVAINKIGDSSGDESDFYGINSAIFTYNGGTLNISNSNKLRI